MIHQTLRSQRLKMNRVLRLASVAKDHILSKTSSSYGETSNASVPSLLDLKYANLEFTKQFQRTSAIAVWITNGNIHLWEQLAKGIY